MEYVGIQTQKKRNNIRSFTLLFLFPILVLALIFLFYFLLFSLAGKDNLQSEILTHTFQMTLQSTPYVYVGVAIWFIIAFFANTSIIKSATDSHSLSRKENKRIYNLVENLCMASGTKMPKINVIEDNSLNAFASGINNRTYTVTLTRGIINRLDDNELEGVIAHELSHIRNNDVRLLIISIVFVGIFAMIAQICLKSIRYMPMRTNSKGKGGGGIIVVILLLAVVAGIGYFFGTLLRFAISRKREFLADAGAAEMTKNPEALASALRKISSDPNVESIKREDVAQLFIEHPGKQAKGFLGKLGGLFATHPSIKDRIRILEQF